MEWLDKNSRTPNPSTASWKKKAEVDEEEEEEENWLDNTLYPFWPQT